MQVLAGRKYSDELSDRKRLTFLPAIYTTATGISKIDSIHGEHSLVREHYSEWEYRTSESIISAIQRVYSATCII